MSIGIPMLTEGQDFLSSKHGVGNTYMRGDLNAMDYRLLRVNRSTHEYFKKFIKFRMSKYGKILRLSNTPNKTYFRFFRASASSACALLYNADKTFKKKLIFAINPHSIEATINFEDFDLRRCRVLANEEKFFTFSKRFRDKFIGGELVLPPMSCRLYTMK
jgi:pullulanase/glycogen debranching enzyme